MNSKKYTVFAVNSMLIILLSFTTCAKEQSEEDKLKNIVNEAAEASQKKDIDAIRKHISKAYKDADGNDYDGVRRILVYHFIRAEAISVFVRSTDVEIKGDTAVVAADVVLVRGREVKSIKDILPESAAGYRFDVIFKKENGDWKTISAQWRDVGVAGLL